MIKGLLFCQSVKCEIAFVNSGLQTGVTVIFSCFAHENNKPVNKQIRLELGLRTGSRSKRYVSVGKT